jgi:hypothetical protein
MEVRPSFFAEFPFPIPLDLYSLPQLETLIDKIRRYDATNQAHNLVVRCGAGSVEEAATPYLDGLPDSTPIERQLLDGKLHIMILNLDRFDGRVSRLLRDFVTALRPTLDASGSGMFRPMAALFVSSPNSIARLHNDPEHGYLHQLRGSKIIYIYPAGESKYQPRPRPGETMAEFAEKTRRFLSDFDAVKYSYAMTPGQAVHIPNLAPHWVLAGPAISISLSFNFFSRTGLQRQKIAQLNRWIERRGWRQVSYRGGTFSDKLKCVTYDALSRVGRARLT